jgi:hypothetical protein
VYIEYQLITKIGNYYQQFPLWFFELGFVGFLGFRRIDFKDFRQQSLLWKNGGCRDAIYRVLLELDSDFY